MKGKLLFSLIVLNLFALSTPLVLFAQRVEQFDLKGAVKEVRYFRADFFNRFGRWELAPFFPFSNPLKEIGDRHFDQDGYCQKLFYLEPDGDSRYTAVYKRNDEGNRIKIEQTAMNYLTGDGEKRLLNYNQAGQLESFSLYLKANHPEEVRRFFYEKKIVREEAYGYSGKLYEKVFYRYDEQGRCIEKEIRGFPYDMLLSKNSYRYDELGRLIQQVEFNSDSQPIQKLYFSYDEGELPVQQIVHLYQARQVERNYYRFKWKLDEKGNWIEKIEVSLVKQGGKWEEIPKTFYRREISYF